MGVFVWQLQELVDSYQQFTELICEFLEEAIPGFDKVMKKVESEAEGKFRRRVQSGKKKIEAMKRAQQPKSMVPDNEEEEEDDDQ